MNHIQQWTETPHLFSGVECDQIQQQCADVLLDRATVVGVKKSLARTCQSGWLEGSDQTAWIFDRIREEAMRVNDEQFNFELRHMEILQYLEYGFGQFYATHTDNGAKEVATRKLTMVIQLSDPSEYLGGSLRIFSSLPQSHATKGRGNAVFFPSHLPHRANPVWQGRRKALVAWFRGQKPLS